MMRPALLLLLSLLLIASDLSAQESKEVPLSQLKEQNRRLRAEIERQRKQEKSEEGLPANNPKANPSDPGSNPATSSSAEALKDSGPIMISIQVQGLPPSVNARQLLSRIESLLKEKKVPLATGKVEGKSILRIIVSGNASREIDIYGIYMAVEMLRPVALAKKSQVLGIFWQVNSVSLATTEQAPKTVEGYLLPRVEQFIADYQRSNR